MKKLMLLLLVLGLVSFSQFGVSAAFEQEPGDDVRGAFLTTRPKSAAPSPNRNKAVRRRPKNTATNSGNNSASGTKLTVSNTGNKSTAPAKSGDTASTPKIREAKIGLGLTLFMRDANGLSVRVDPSREFRKGDRVRLLLETNVDGYLYVFNTTDGGQPLMIYPDPSLDEAGNYIQAHVPVEVPSSVAEEERLRWFRFDEQAGTERLYFVFSREPLTGIPLEDELIGFCRESNQNCPLRPATDLWAKIQQDMGGAPIQSAKAQEYGSTQTHKEHQATTRGIGLSKDDPEPSLVMMTSSTNKAALVTALELIHK
jgi:hypothetical protein